MKMTVEKLKKLLTERLEKEGRNIAYNREKDQLRVENAESGKGVTLSLGPVLAKWERNREKAIDEIVFYVEEALKAMETEVKITGNERKIFPVIRSTSFPKTAGGKPLVYDEHTAETRIFYSLDMGSSYRLIDEGMLADEGLDAGRIKEMARFNLRSLDHPVKKDSVSGNDFYFVNTNDGYDASRILNESFLKEMEKKIKGEMVLSVPHQDVLIISDIQNSTGYDVLAHMTMHFYTSGRVPITPLSFYLKDGELEPIFIMAKNKPGRKE